MGYGMISPVSSLFHSSVNCKVTNNHSVPYFYVILVNGDGHMALYSGEVDCTASDAVHGSIGFSIDNTG